MIHLRLLFFALALSWLACDPPQEPASADTGMIRIDSLLESHIPRLIEAGAVQKTVKIGDELPETLDFTFTAEEWKEELDFFLSANIHRKSWADDFSIDSNYQGQQLHITYRADRDRIPVKSCTIRQDSSGQLEFLHITIRRSTALSSLERNLIYAFPDSIRIDNTEEFSFLSPHQLAITYRWK